MKTSDMLLKQLAVVSRLEKLGVETFNVYDSYIYAEYTADEHEMPLVQTFVRDENREAVIKELEDFSIGKVRRVKAGIGEIVGYRTLNDVIVEVFT